MKKLYAKPINFLCCYLCVVFNFVISPQNRGDYPPNSNIEISSISYKDTDLRDVLRTLAYQHETNILIDNDISKKISVTLFNVTLFDAIRIIVEDNDYDFSYDKQRFIVKKQGSHISPQTVENYPIISYNKGKIDVSAENVEIRNFIDNLRESTNKNFLLTSGTSGRISGILTNIDFEAGIRNLLQNNGYYLNFKDSIYYISRSTYFSSIETNFDQLKQPYWVSAQNGKITIDVSDANLDVILNDISRQLDLQVIKLASPNVNVTVRCTDVTVDVALKHIFRGTEFSYKKEHGAYIVGRKGANNLDNTKLIRVSYLRADKIKEKIPQSMQQNTSINISSEHNALIVNGTLENVLSIEDYIKTIDQPVIQVMIEALVIDFNYDDVTQRGISAGRGDSVLINQKDKWYPGFNVTASGNRINRVFKDIGNVNIFGQNIDFGKLGKLPEDFYVNIKALEQSGVVNIKSKPLLSTLNGHTASLKIGTVQNYVFTEIVPIVNAIGSTFIEKETIEKIEANISFEITPWVGPNNELTLEIKPSFETPIGSFSPDKKLIPAINTRSLFSTVRLRDGESIVLGGMIQESEVNIEDKIPLLGDIPIIGELFKSVDKKKSKGELLIYLTPRIFYGDDFSSTLYNYSK